MIKLRVDVDYPYPSRLRSFFYTGLGLRTKADYLKNSKILAKMINESAEDVKAYWFFTLTTTPDDELMALLNNGRHEIALHIVNEPYMELKLLEDATGKNVRYYTVHGTARLLARVMWRRWKAKAPTIPNGFPLQSFYQFPTHGLDLLCYNHSTKQAVKIAKSFITRGYFLHVHPIWLFQRGRINQRGPFYETLRRILDVDGDIQTVTISKKSFFKMARETMEYERDVIPGQAFTQKLGERGADVFTFIERRWHSVVPNPQKTWTRADDNVALLRVNSYREWWEGIGKKTRNMVRKAEKSGIRTEVAEPSQKLAEGIWKIYNESPIRQERGFPHYGTHLKTVREGVMSSTNCTYVAAYTADELAGFLQLVHGDDITVISQLLSLQKHFDKAVNNALLAKAVEVCADKHVQWLMYGRIGNHPSLDRFKQNNGFSQFPLKRYYIALTKKGRIATRLGLHREMKDVLPQPLKNLLIPLYNWTSRTKTMTRLRLRKPST